MIESERNEGAYVSACSTHLSIYNCPFIFRSGSLTSPTSITSLFLLPTYNLLANSLPQTEVLTQLGVGEGWYKELLHNIVDKCGLGLIELIIGCQLKDREAMCLPGGRRTVISLQSGS